MKTAEFKQTAKVGVAGSLINQLMGNNSSLPVVGKGATVMSYSDRHVYEVVEVSEDMKRVKLESLNAVGDPSKKNDIGHQNWIFEHFTEIVWRNGSWKSERNIVEFDKAYYEDYESQPYSQERWEEMIKPLFDNKSDLIFVEGKTVKKKKYDRISILFGQKDYYYDWSF